VAPEGTPDAMRRLESGVIGRAWGEITRHARVLGWMAFGAYVVTPTALALRLDGLPLNTKPELLALLAASLLGWARLAGWLMRSTGTPARASSSARVPAVVAWPLVAATAVFLFLVPVKLAYPPSDGLALCLRSPEIPEPGCVWSPEGPAPGPGRDVTRYEPLGYFDRVRGRAWRLGYLNTRHFAGFDEPQDTPEGRRQRLRVLDANPFDASLRLSPRLAALLASRFGDETGTVTFAGSVRGALALTAGSAPEEVAAPAGLHALRSFRARVPRDRLESLVWHYRNYDCPEQECHRTMAFRTVPVHDAVLELRVEAPAGSRGFVLGYGHLRVAMGDPWTRTLRWLEGLGVALLGWAVGAVPAAQALGRVVRPVVRPTPFALVTLGAAVAGAMALTGGLGVLFETGASFWLTLPATTFLLLAASSAAWRSELMQRLRGVENRYLLFAWMLPLMGFVLAAAVYKAPGSDEVTPLWAGDDAVNYAWLARDLLREPGLLTDPPSVVVKPAFLYLRALLYGLIGEGEQYVSTVVRAGFLAVYALAGFVVFAVLLETIARARSPVARWAPFVLHAGILVWLTSAFLGYGAMWSSLLFSEGPAWLLFTLSAVGVAHAVVGDRVDTRSVALVGVPFAASCLFRTHLVLFAPLVAGGFLLPEAGGHSRWRALCWGLGFPLAVAGVLIVGHALPSLPTLAQFTSGVARNTSVKPGHSVLHIFGGDVSRLFPSPREWTVAGVFAGLLAWSVIREWVAGDREARACAMRLLAFGGLCVLGGFVLQIPLLPTGYYPRTIMPTYFFLIVFMAVWADRLSRERGGVSPRYPLGTGNDGGAGGTGRGSGTEKDRESSDRRRPERRGGRAVPM
jgi:hypothetical protein